MKTEMMETEKLLKEVNWFLKNKKLEVEKNEDTFNMFRICGVNHYENTHSSILAELLDPNASHQFEHKFLDAFIQTLIKLDILPPEYQFAYQGVKVHREYSTSYGRLDILITNSLDEALLIENKIYASDQFEQLKRYHTFGAQKFNNKFKLLYLTLWGNESPQDALDKTEYLQVSYSEAILQWLERCVEIAAKSPIVRETLIQYSNHIKNLTHQNTESKMNKELIDQLSSVENLDAVFTISENISHVKNNLINNVLLKQLEEIGKELNIVSQSESKDYVNTSWAGFSFAVNSWKNYNIFLEFGARGLRNLIIGLVPKNDQVDTSAFPIIKEKVGGGNARCAYIWFPKYQDWNADAMKAIVNGEMKNLIKNEIIKLIDALKEVEGV